MSIGGRSKVKFMCSFGGKILPRPSDGLLKYVGGETRVIAVSPDITFLELTKKLTEMTETDMVLKYQIIPEDLDALVSVKSDEDLKHMMDEYNRHHETPKLRTFLFPANPTVQLGSPIEPQTIEQRYIEAINGILRKTAPIKTRPSFTLSASSSPKSESSPDGYGNEQPEMGSSYQLSRLYPMHRVRSSPNISQQSQPHNYHHHHNHHSAYFQPPNYLTCRLRPPPPPPLDFPRGAGWDPQGKYGCSEERRFRGRASSVPQSPRNHGFRL
ncbi:hypothetical protein Bca4012_018626 [Brassica carinata]|uniref:PB1 domain-containing protein n=1 Tax=Brassica carinata TaxID=52824 RepID=A0A8X7WJ05_BRACI|nr:hypothetical protein Bca52824_002934 [Brassica carinata]